MDNFRDQNIFDTPSKQSYVGSFYLPPEKLSVNGLARELNEPKARSSVLLQDIDAETYRCAPDAGSRAVIAALRTLQEKMRRLELERAQAEKNVQRFANATQQHANAHASTSTSSTHISRNGSSVTLEELPRSREDRNAKQRTELATQLQCAESRCSLLEKQLHYMKKMLESAGEGTSRTHPPAKTHTPPTDKTHTHPPDKTHTHPPAERGAHTAKKAHQKESSVDNIQLQLNKLEKLERECVKLTNTQSLAERKIQLLEKRLQEEEKERRLIQQKAEELQRELQVNLLMRSAEVAESKPSAKKKKEKLPVKKSESGPKLPLAKRPPFVAGTSTSPSHSVSANMQSLCHLLKQQQQRVHEGQSEGGRRRLRECQLQKQVDEKARSPCAQRSGYRGRQRSSSEEGESSGNSPPCREDSSPDCLSRLLLTLQDELGRSSFEHQEMVRQISDTKSRRVREDLERELDVLVRNMETKATQITQLRKHQRTVERLKSSSKSPKKQQQNPTGSKVKKIQALSSSKKRTRPHSASRDLRSNLCKDDIMWES